MAKTLDILKYFPQFHHAKNRNKLIFHVVDTLAARLLDLENDLVKVLKSHWIEKAEQKDDLVLIARLYGIEAEEHEKLNDFRSRILKIIGLYLEGPGTVRSLFEFITIVLFKYTIECERDSGGELIILHPFNGDEFHSRVMIYFDNKESSVDIIENPLHTQIRRKENLVHNDSWQLVNTGFFNRCPVIRITGKKDRSINPVIFNRTTGCELGFYGVIPENEILVLVPDGDGFLKTAVIGERNVTERVYAFKGAQFDVHCYDESGTVVAQYYPPHGFQYIACDENDYYWTDSLLNPEFIEPPASRVLYPWIPLGESRWSFRTGSSAYGYCRFDETAYTFLEYSASIYDKSALDGSLYLPASSGSLEMEWETRKRTSIMVKIPCVAGKKAAAMGYDFNEPLQRIKKIIEKIKAAGIHTLVSYKRKDWILGENILYDESFNGDPGSDCETTNI